MNQEQEYLNMINDTAKFVAQERAARLGDAAAAFHSSGQLANDVEFWNWMGKNYPKDLSSTELIQQASNSDIVNITLHFFLKDVRPMQHPVMNHSIVVA